MLHFSKKRILEFQKIMKEEYNEKLSLKETSEAAHNLIGFFDLLHKIDTRIKKEKNNK